MVKPVLSEDRLLGVLGGRLVSLFFALFCLGEKTSLLLLLGFRLVLVQKLEELRGSVLVEGMRELGDSGRDLRCL